MVVWIRYKLDTDERGQHEIICGGKDEKECLDTLKLYRKWNQIDDSKFTIRQSDKLSQEKK